MANSAGLLDWLLEGLAPLGGVAARRMFGGHGLFRHGLMFALVVRDTPYLKVDASTRAAFEAAGSQPFTYARQGRTATLGYWQGPGAVRDDADAGRAWAAAAWAVALRARRAG